MLAITYFTIFQWFCLPSLLSTFPKYATNITCRGIVYELKQKVILTPTSVFSSNTELTIWTSERPSLDLG